ncbi:MAG: DegT/DnrJ/EryC1/StrS aminotransferase family protein [Spirochaetales bacterium]|jgi:perosamine synthetase|nr:DegT/DnrJ/EryC1/StrS aminotransferase family protein [Spirochaetales bacterium]
MPISIFKPTIKRRDMDAVLTALVEDKLGPGSVAQALIQQCADYLDVSGGLALREYRRAVDLAFDALEISVDQCVVVSPLAPLTYLNSLKCRGAKILYADVDPNTGCLTADSISSLMRFEPKAVLIDSPFGFVPDLNVISDLEIPIVEDVSASLGAHCFGRKCGSFGRYTVVSLEENCIVTAGGGAIVLSKTKRDLGQLRAAGENLDESSFLPDMNAALAGMQLKHIEEFILKRRDIAAAYSRSLMKGRHRTFIQDGDSENIFFSFPVVLEGSAREAVKYARSKKVTVKEAFSDSIISRFENDDSSCPNAQALHLRCILFPLYPMLSRDQVEQVSRVISSLP